MHYYRYYLEQALCDAVSNILCQVRKKNLINIICKTINVFFLVTRFAGTIILVRRFSFVSQEWRRVCRKWRDKFKKKYIYISFGGIRSICLIHNSFPLTQSITQNGIRPWQSHFYCFSLYARARARVCVSCEKNIRQQ